MTRYLFSLSRAIAFGLAAATTALAQSPAPDGRAVFENTCSVCHTGAADTRAPSPDVLRTRSPESIVSALTGGAMFYFGERLSGAERRAVAEYLTGKKMGAAIDLTGATIGRCTTSPVFTDPSKSPSWMGWSPSVTNTHFQPAAQAGLTSDQTPRLTLKWALGFPDAERAWSEPAVASGRVFVGSQNGTIYSLDAKTGCIYWAYSADGAVRTAIVIGPRNGGGSAAYFSDQRGNVYALGAATGKLLWKRHVEDHPLVRLTGTPTLYQGRLYVPAASLEESHGGVPSYECCTFRGSLSALDAQTGAVIWKTFTITDEPKPRKKSDVGTTLWGPSGAGTWSAPAIDAKRGAIYVTTGNSYSDPMAPNADSILALDMKTGKIRWAFHGMEKDVAINACSANGVNPTGVGARSPNCPEEQGPDQDFGSPPVLVTLPNGKDLVIAGQKAVAFWALDPDRQGQVVWKHQISQDGRGGSGVMWGTAADGGNAYFPLGASRQPGETSAGGVYAVSLATGERVWFTPTPVLSTCGTSAMCNGGVANGLTVIPGAVFAGSNDGGVRAYSTKDGSILWQFDTNREFKTVNGVPAKGASIMSAGPIVVGGMVFVNSGYGLLGRPGNVLLAFGPE
jgi:polyvinyl alcohol dehydrogenase (cytochrome)